MHNLSNSTFGSESMFGGNPLILIDCHMTSTFLDLFLSYDPQQQLFTDELTDHPVQVMNWTVVELLLNLTFSWGFFDWKAKVQKLSKVLYLKIREWIVQSPHNSYYKKKWKILLQFQIVDLQNLSESLNTILHYYLLIIYQKRSEYCWIIVQTKSRGYFKNVYWAYGE